MKDGFGREIDYMRISITDRCNLRCRYCMPEGISWIPMEEILTFEEIEVVVKEAATLGIKKIKVTGGEPRARIGCPTLVGMLKKVPGIEKVTLTTNGVFLSKYAEQLKEKGLDAVNISLDTLDEKRFEEITGRDELKAVLDGIETALELQIPVKINSVLQKGQNEKEWQALAELAHHKKLDVRFIEMMPIGYGKKFEPVYNEELLKKMEEKYGELKPDTRVHGNGPAIYYSVPGFEGSIGFISAIHGKFCKSCNRIRMTSTGDIKACLCFDESLSIKEALRAGDMEEVNHLLVLAISNKPVSHQFEQKEMITEQREMASIGG